MYLRKICLPLRCCHRKLKCERDHQKWSLLHKATSEFIWYHGSWNNLLRACGLGDWRPRKDLMVVMVMSILWAVICGINQLTTPEVSNRFGMHWCKCLACNNMYVDWDRCGYHGGALTIVKIKTVFEIGGYSRICIFMPLKCNSSLCHVEISAGKREQKAVGGLISCI